MLQLNDKVAIVTGAGRGNGRGVAMAKFLSVSAEQYGGNRNKGNQ